MFTIETQIPYGTIVSRTNHWKRGNAVRELAKACAKASKQKGFVVTFHNGKEISYAQLRADTASPLY